MARVSHDGTDDALRSSLFGALQRQEKCNKTALSFWSDRKRVFGVVF